MNISAALCVIIGVKMVHTFSDYSALLAGKSVLGNCEANKSSKQQ